MLTIGKGDDLPFGESFDVTISFLNAKIISEVDDVRHTKDVDNIVVPSMGKENLGSKMSTMGIFSNIIVAEL